MTVSEWGMPIKRGGVATTVGEYSISTIGPGERARHMGPGAGAGAADAGQDSVRQYVGAVGGAVHSGGGQRRPACRQSAGAGLNGLMLGWTLGGYPSPNLEVVAEIGMGSREEWEVWGRRLRNWTEAMVRVAQRRFGQDLAPQVVRAWQDYSRAFREFPFHGGLVYSAPMQVGPANLLWGEPTGYAASMVGFPYDDLDGWRAVYPPEVFVGQFDKVASGFEPTFAEMTKAFQAFRDKLTAEQRAAALKELNVGEAAAIHFRTVANQARFILARRRLAGAKSQDDAQSACDELEGLLRAEMGLARRLHAIQSRDSRIGFEATNQYYYVPVDLAEKVINCHYLLTRWLPAARRRRHEGRRRSDATGTR